MEKLIFVCPSNVSEPETVIWATSIRKFAGALADCPIWVLTPKSDKEISKEMKKQLSSLNVQIIPYAVDPDVDQFPFVAWVNAAAVAESLAKEKTELLAWIDKNSIIINEPKHFLLDENKNLGYRPVHHTLIGSIYDEPIDSFWELVYQKCNVLEEKIFPMKTHVDGNILRPYFNSGFLIVRPERGLLQAWWGSYKKMYRDSSFKEFYEKDDLYTIFIHQAVLSGVILSTMEKQELQELPFSYNYPLHLYDESLKEYRPKAINDLITVRYYLDKLLKPQGLDKLPIHDPLKSWLADKLESIKNTDTSIKKVKFGKTPIIYPIPIILAGALVNGKPNFETLGDVGIMGLNPPIVYISSGQKHFTNEGILEHGTFSINFPPTKLLAKTDYCGTVSGRDVDKSQLFEVFFGELETAPMIRECPVNLECKVIKEFSIQHRQIFVGEVVQAYLNEEFVVESEGRKRIADMRKLDPIIYALDNRYYKIGEPIGIGYQESKKFSKE